MPEQQCTQMVGIFPKGYNKKTVLLLIAFLLFGCVGTPVCRHNALYEASIAQEKYPVRIVLGYLDQTPHCQAQAQINEDWEYISHGMFGVTIDSKDNGFNVVEYMTLEEFVNRWFKICP